MAIGARRDDLENGDDLEGCVDLEGCDVAKNTHDGCAASIGRARLALVAAIAVYIVLAAVIALKTPAWESADEPAHVQNIETLVSGHWYGMNTKCINSFGTVDCSGAEAHQAPLYYLVFAGWQRLVGLPSRPVHPGPVNSHYPSISHGLFANHSAADHRFLLWLRLPNIILGALTILTTYLAARIIISDPWTPVVAAAIVAFRPRLLFLSAFVTNDNLVTFLGAVLTLAALRYVVSPTTWRMAFVGVVVGLLVLTKLSALPLAIILPVLAYTPRGWMIRARTLAIGVATSLVVSGWYLIQNTVRYGDPLV